MTNVNANNLLDNWMVSGTDKNVLLDTLKDLDKSAKVLSCRTDQIQIMTIVGKNDSVIAGYLHNCKENTTNKPIPFDKMREEGMTDAICDETLNQSHLLFRFGDGVFFTSKRVLKTLSQRAGSHMGDFAMRDEVKIRFHRDAGYVAYMATVPSLCNVFYRQIGDAKKVYAVFTDKYKILPQHELIGGIFSDFEQEMGAMDLKHFSVDNYGTDIYIEFPEKAADFKKVYGLKDDIIPGLRIFTSDVGESSFIVYGTLRIGKGITYIPTAQYSRAHTKFANVGDIVKSVGEKVFGEYTKMPERLMELLMIDIADPASVIQKVSKACGIKKEFGMKVEREFVEDLCCSINPSVAYTAYDIALMFVDKLSEMEEGRLTEYVNDLRMCAAKAVFFKYEN